jgi:hypothetical protein
MRLQRETLRGAIAARDDLAEADARTHRARVRYEHAIRRLQASGATLREIAAALSLSHQRVHQLLDPSTGKGALRKVSAHTAEPCSFCGAMPARGLVAGSKVSICARCAGLAHELLETDVDVRIDGGTKLAAIARQRSDSRCTFCGQQRSEVEGMIEAPLRPGVGRYARRAPGVRICSDCLTVCLEILEGANGARPVQL